MAREPFNDVWANAPTDPGNDASFIEPRAVIFDTGWEGGADKDAPKAGEQNWWQNRADSALQDLERYGAMTWDADSIYAAGAPVRATDSNYYESLGNANSSNDPTTTNGYWRLIGPSLYSVVPVGSVIAVAHSGVPDTGWLKCNGSVLLRSTYSRLFAKLGTAYNNGTEATTQFRLPDTRGEFIRGWDDSRGVDSGRAFGSNQIGSYIPGDNGLNDEVIYVGNAAGNKAQLGWDVMGPSYPEQFADIRYISVTGTKNPTPIQNHGGVTRPRNLAFNYWIKY